MAQNLALGIRHIAEWGGYQIEIDTRHTQIDVAVTIRQSEAPYRNIIVKRVTTPDAALRWAASWLEEHHCGAFVDGQQRPLVDFLVFIPSSGGAFHPLSN